MAGDAVQSVAHDETDSNSAQLHTGNFKRFLIIFQYCPRVVSPQCDINPRSTCNARTPVNYIKGDVTVYI